MPRDPSADLNRRQGISVVISDLASGGAQRVAMTLIAHWLGQGKTITLITHSEPSDDFHAPPPGCRRISTRGKSSSQTILGGLYANVRRIVLLRRAIRRSEADLVVAFMGQTIITALLACIGLPVKFIACERNDPARLELQACSTRQGISPPRSRSIRKYSPATGGPRS